METLNLHRLCCRDRRNRFPVGSQKQLEATNASLARPDLGSMPENALPSISGYLRSIYFVILFEVFILLVYGLYTVNSDLKNFPNQYAWPSLNSLRTSAELSVEVLNAEASDNVVEGVINLGYFSRAEIRDDFGRTQSVASREVLPAPVADFIARILRLDLEPSFEIRLDITSTNQGLFIAEADLRPTLVTKLMGLLWQSIIIGGNTILLFFLIIYRAGKRITAGVEALVDHTDHSLNSLNCKTRVPPNALSFREFQNVAERSDLAIQKLRSSMTLVQHYQVKEQDLIDVLAEAFRQTGMLIVIRSENGEVLFENYASATSSWVSNVFGAQPKNVEEIHQILLDQPELTVRELGPDTGPLSSGILSKQYQVDEGEFSWLLSWTFLESGAIFLMLQEITKSRAIAKTEMHAEKMEALGRIASGVAHEFNNVLAIIIFNLEMLEMSKPVNPKIMAHVSPALRAANRASVVVEQLKSKSKTAHLAKVQVSIKNWITAIEPMLKVVVGPQVQMEIDVDPSLIIETNESFLDTAVINLCKNAKEAMESGGAVKISCAQATDIEKDAAGLEQSRTYAAIRVADTGPGFRGANLHKVAEPFFTTKPMHLGTGLGLSSVYDYAVRDNGGLLIGNNKNGGGFVTIFKPVKNIASAAAAKSSSGANLNLEEKYLLRRKVLVVEDEKGLSDLYRVMLTKAGAIVTTCRDIEQGLQAIATHPTFDLAIIDLTLPDGSGTRILDSLSEHCPDCKNIVVSGDFTWFDAENEGKVCMIEKPFSLSHLAQTCRGIAKTIA